MDSKQQSDPLGELRDFYTTIYRTRLPALARQRNCAQPKWPVTLDHCFARIILDNAVGKDKPWGEVVKAPATKNMSEQQLRDAIKLGEQIVDGEVDLVELDQRSLDLRGKTKAGTKTTGKRKTPPVQDVTDGADDQEAERETGAADKKKPRTRKGEVAEIWSTWTAIGEDGEKRQSKAPTNTPVSSSCDSPSKQLKQKKIQDDPETMERMRKVIANDSSLSAFRRRVLSLLTQVPRGRYTTYKSLADAVARLDKGLKAAPQSQSKDESVSSPRAVGSAMRNNPFAPTVPCHRVLATGGKLGGFGGDWGEEGKFAGEKRRLLREEGVQFDGKGKVVGSPYTDFK